MGLTRLILWSSAGKIHRPEQEDPELQTEGAVGSQTHILIGSNSVVLGYWKIPPVTSWAELGVLDGFRLLESSPLRDPLEPDRVSIRRGAFLATVVVALGH